MENNNGGYDLEGIVWHQHSNKLLVKIMELWPKTTAIFDIGCGHNFYVNVLTLAGYGAMGFDLVPFPGVIIRDVTQPLPYEPGPPINILSLECGEHIPFQLADGYLDNLTKYGGDIIMSWAVPGQAGVGHINNQSNEWVIEKMGLRGYVHVPELTRELREAVNGCRCDWFLNTLLYFKPNE